jgi:acetoin:2,6-dichlorophenolindophenol oxidoreductase subunit beta
VHEACRFGGFGGEIAAAIGESEAFYHLDAPIRRLAGRDVPIPYNKHLEAGIVPTTELIIRTVRDMVR